MKAVVYTLGCKVNDVESGSIIRGLELRGYKVSREMEAADLYVVNTCAVTAEAERKSRQTVSKALKCNPNGKVIVCGCASEKSPMEFFDKDERVIAVTGAQKKNRVLPRPISAIWVEILVAVKGASRLFANVGTLIAMPMLIYLLNKIFLAMNTRAMGNFMVVAFNVLMILLIGLNSNFYASSIYSRDGRSAYLIKTQPARYWPLLVAKLVPSTLFMLLAFIATYVILLTTTSIGALSVSVMMLGLVAIYLAHLLYCAEMDLMNPQIELYATVGGSERNINESRATLTAFLVSFAVAGIMLLLLLEGGTNVYAKLSVLSAAVLAYRLYMFFSKIKLYYKEK